MNARSLDGSAVERMRWGTMAHRRFAWRVLLLGTFFCRARPFVGHVHWSLTYMFASYAIKSCTITTCARGGRLAFVCREASQRSDCIVSWSNRELEVFRIENHVFDFLAIPSVGNVDHSIGGLDHGGVAKLTRFRLENCRCLPA